MHPIKDLPFGPPAQSFPSNSKDLSVKALAARRHSRFAPAILLLLALVTVGVVYALAAPRTATASEATQEDIDVGSKLFRSNCATCHGPAGEGTETGPSLIGVGAASVDFQGSEERRVGRGWR